MSLQQKGVLCFAPPGFCAKNVCLCLQGKFHSVLSFDHHYTQGTHMLSVPKITRFAPPGSTYVLRESAVILQWMQGSSASVISPAVKAAAVSLHPLLTNVAKKAKEFQIDEKLHFNAIK